MRSRTASTMRQSATVGYVVGTSFHCRMRMLPGCSSSRISRVNSLMPRGHSRLAAEKAPAQGRVEESQVPGGGSGSGEVSAGTPPVPRPTRFHGTATLDSERVGRNASRIADEVIAHLSSLVRAKVTVTLEIEAEVPEGAPDHVVRTVTENSRTLKFTSQGFEKE